MWGDAVAEHAPVLTRFAVGVTPGRGRGVMSGLAANGLLRCIIFTCRPFSVKLSPSGTGCLLLSSLLRLSLPFDQQFDATLSLICSPMVYLSYFLSFLW